MEAIGQVFEVPDNILSDIMNPEIRSKVEDFDKGIFITLKTFCYHKRNGQLTVDNFSLILFDDTLISFQEEPDSMFDPVRERLHKYSKKIRTGGSDYLAFALLDVIIDNYIYVLTMDVDFWSSILFTVKFTIVSTIFTNVGAILLARILTLGVLGENKLRIAFLATLSVKRIALPFSSANGAGILAPEILENAKKNKTA